jgi:pyruvate dehydrogenase E1 component
VADLIRPYIKSRYVALGTDGFGRSDTRAALRAFFEVDARHIAVAALGAIDPSLVGSALRRYGIDPVARPPWER